MGEPPFENGLDCKLNLTLENSITEKKDVEYVCGWKAGSGIQWRTDFTTIDFETSHVLSTKIYSNGHGQKRVTGMDAI